MQSPDKNRTDVSAIEVWDRLRKVSVPGGWPPSKETRERGYFTVRVTMLGWVNWQPVADRGTT